MKKSNIAADLIIKGRNIFTSKEEQPSPAAVLIRNNIISDVVAYGSEGVYAGPETEVIDAGDRLVMPGFVDAHTHFFQGAIVNSEYVCTDIENSVSEEDCVRIIASYAKAHPEYKRIRGAGWFLPKWNNAPLPTKESIDRVIPEIPVYLVCADTHSMWLNSKALEECGITADMPVRSGYVGLLPNGELSGMLIEPDAYAPAMDKYMELSNAEKAAAYRQLSIKASSLGVTSMSEMYADDYNEETYHKYSLVKQLEKESGLLLRLFIFTRLFGYYDFTEVLSFKERVDSELVKIAGVKGFIDGVAETYTGLLLEPYSDRPDTRGIDVPLEPEESMRKSIINANRAGLPVRLHCIADGSVRLALNMFAESNRLNGNRGFQNTIEHIENIHPDDIKRFKEENILPSMQPMHLLLDCNGKIIRIGSERIKYEWAFRSVLEGAGDMAFGSDYPVVDLNPLLGIYAAVTRKDLDGVPTGNNTNEAVSLAQALKAYTIGAAKAYNMEHRIGTIESGKLADIIILNRNLFSIPVSDILKAKVNITVCNGKIVYRSDY